MKTRLNIWTVIVTAALTLSCFLAVPVIAAWKVDTNGTTDATDYTPERPGEMLLGYIGGTATVWVSTGQTSNDWVAIPAGGTTTNLTYIRGAGTTGAITIVRGVITAAN